jgi:hypothetical protein
VETECLRSDIAAGPARSNCLFSIGCLANQC